MPPEFDKSNAQFGAGKGSTFSHWQAFIPALLVLLGMVVGVIILINQHRAQLDLETQFHMENHLRLDSTVEHIREYFDGIYSTLLFISLDSHVMGLSTSSRQQIQQVFDHHWETHRLAEVYIIERDFDGTRPPLMTFERGAIELSLEKEHTLEREQEEYRTQMAQIQRFDSNPKLEALISGEIALCVADSVGERAHGLVYSVPIRAGSELIGIVAGMAPLGRIEEVLTQGQFHSKAFLVNERGELFCRQSPERTWIRQWLNTGQQATNTGQFFAQLPETISLHGWVGLWAPVDIVSDQKWWSILLYDQAAYLEATASHGWLRTWLLTFTVVFASVVSALLVRATTRRLKEETIHAQDRRRLEREIQNASEREQSRIGQCLHEDLCQRFVGIEAMCRAFEKQLSCKGLQESELVSSIADEIGEALSQARGLAQELHPIALESLGLLAAIGELAGNVQKRTGLTCKVEGEDVPEFYNPTVSIHLYRIIQEALNNVVQHAQASHVTIRFATGDKEKIILSIRDDGVGIPPFHKIDKGIGLQIMHHRSDIIGGSLEIKPHPDGGTLVTCSLPRTGHVTR